MYQSRRAVLFIIRLGRVELTADQAKKDGTAMPQPSASRQHPELRLAQQRRNRRRARVFNAAMGILAILASLASMISQGSNPSAIVLLISIITGFGVTVLLIVTRAWRWPRMQARLAPEVLSSDHRAPVVYLRPFEADSRSYRYEGRIARSLKGLGPVVTVGRPDEKLPATPHMAREYLRDDQWQDRVLELLFGARLVVAHAGASEGLAWELVQVVRLGRPERLIVCLGHDRLPWFAGGRSSTVRYREFREHFAPLFPKGLPAELGGSAFVAFGPDWTPIPSSELQGAGAGHPLTVTCSACTGGWSASGWSSRPEQRAAVDVVAVVALTLSWSGYGTSRCSSLGPYGKGRQ